MIYDLKNPSDTVSFVAPDRKIAALVCFIVGTGQYCASAYNDDGKRIEEEDVPFFMLGGFEAFWSEACGGPLEKAIEHHKTALIEALESVALAAPDDRILYDEALQAITADDRRQAFIARWNDRKRTSMNDIMGRAHALAKKLRGSNLSAEETDKTRVPRQIFAGR